ncbi:hypothetical protein FOZ60_004556 [Perkinsus olseni]|uniref:Ubiquitin-like domain-containing protein n=1 Tax=Perkinsus olseni TaxID=32597 RepID=A0A7J6PGX5_PEROL|nr:hypothetical protein FOZ60_004556 [Perkinsus olseni]
MGGSEDGGTLTVRVVSPAEEEGSYNEVSVRMKPKHKLDKLLRSWCKHQQIPPDTVKLINAEKTEELPPSTRAGELPEPRTVYAVPKSFELHSNEVVDSTVAEGARGEEGLPPASDRPSPPPTPMNVSVVLQQKDVETNRIDVTLPGAVKWSRMLKAWLTKYPSQSRARIRFLLLPDREEVDMDSAVEHVVMGDGHFCRIEVDVTMPTEESERTSKTTAADGSMQLAVINELTGVHSQVVVGPNPARSDFLKMIGHEGPCEIGIDGRLVEGAYLTGVAADGSSTAVIRPSPPALLTVRVRDKRTGVRRTIRCAEAGTVGDVLVEWRRSVDADEAVDIEAIGVDAGTLVSSLRYEEDPYSLMADSREYTLELSSVVPPHVSSDNKPVEDEEPLGFDIAPPPSPRQESTEPAAQSSADSMKPVAETAANPPLKGPDPPPPPEAAQAGQSLAGKTTEPAVELRPSEPGKPQGPTTYLVTVKDARCAWKKMTKRFSDSVDPRPDDTAVYRVLLPGGGTFDIDDENRRIYETLEDGRLVNWKQGDPEPELEVNLMLRDVEGSSSSSSSRTSSSNPSLSTSEASSEGGRKRKAAARKSTLVDEAATSSREGSPEGSSPETSSASTARPKKRARRGGGRTVKVEGRKDTAQQAALLLFYEQQKAAKKLAEDGAGSEGSSRRRRRRTKSPEEYLDDDTLMAIALSQSLAEQGEPRKDETLIALLALPVVSGEEGQPVPDSSRQIVADPAENSYSFADADSDSPRLPASATAIKSTYSSDWPSVLWFVAWWGCILVASLWWLSRKKAWLTREKQQRLEQLVYGGAGAVARFVNQRLPRTVRRSSSGIIDHVQMTRLSEMSFDDVAAPPRHSDNASAQIVGRRTTPEGSVGSRASTPPPE